MSRLRPTVTLGMGLSLVVTLVSACSGGCASLQSIFGGKPPAPGSAQALEGVYEVEEVVEFDRGCERSDSSTSGDRIVRVRRVPVEGNAARETTRLRVEICGARDCPTPVRELTLRRPADGGWRRRSGAGSAVEEAAAARACRLRSVQWQLTSTESGVALKRTVRADNRALEGEESCGRATALGLGSSLRCRHRRVLRAE